MKPAKTMNPPINEERINGEPHPKSFPELTENNIANKEIKIKNAPKVSNIFLLLFLTIFGRYFSPRINAIIPNGILIAKTEYQPNDCNKKPLIDLPNTPPRAVNM